MQLPIHVFFFPFFVILFGRVASSCFNYKANLQQLCIICTTQARASVWCVVDTMPIHVRKRSVESTQGDLSKGKPFCLVIFCMRNLFSI